MLKGFLMVLSGYLGKWVYEFFSGRRAKSQSLVTYIFPGLFALVWCFIAIIGFLGIFFDLGGSTHNAALMFGGCVVVAVVLWLACLPLRIAEKKKAAEKEAEGQPEIQRQADYREENVVAPLLCDVNGYVDCPLCHARQRIGRSSCFGCGVRFYLKPVNPTANENKIETFEQENTILMPEADSIGSEKSIATIETMPAERKNTPVQNGALKPRFCRKCGFELHEGCDYCSHCGTKTVTVPQTAELKHSVVSPSLRSDTSVLSNNRENDTAKTTNMDYPEIKEIRDIFELRGCIGACVHIVSDNLCLVTDYPNRKPCLKYLYIRGDILIGLNLISYDGWPRTRFGEVKEIYGVVKKPTNNEYTYFLDNAFFTPSKSNLSKLKPMPFSDQYAYSELSNNAIRLIDTSNRSITSLTIPEKIGRYTVIEVAGFCSYKKLESVTIPNSVKVLANGAFSYCPLLRKVSLGSNIHEIGHDTFFSSEMIEVFIVSPDNPGLRSIDGLLVSADMKVLVRVPPHRTGRLLVPEGIAVISSYAFRCSMLDEVVFPNTVREIKKDAFYFAKSVKQMTLPASVRKIEDRALITDGSFSFEDDDDYEEAEDNRAIVITSKGSYAEKYAKDNHHPVRYI